MGNKFVFQRANPSDPIVAELQTGSHYRSVDHLLQEADDVMNIINGTQSDANQGTNIQGASSTAPPVAPAAQNATTVGEQRGANKRTHGTMAADWPVLLLYVKFQIRITSSSISIQALVSVCVPAAPLFYKCLLATSN